MISTRMNSNQWIMFSICILIAILHSINVQGFRVVPNKATIFSARFSTGKNRNRENSNNKKKIGKTAIVMDTDIIANVDLPSNTTKSFLETEAFEKRLARLLDQKLPVPISVEEELKAMQYLDVGTTENLYTVVLPKIQRLKMDAKLDNDYERLNEIQKNYETLMNAGFWRRYQMEKDYQDPHLTTDHTISTAAKHLMDRRKSKEEIMEELMEKKKKERGIFINMLPSPLQPYMEYIRSLHIQPKLFDLQKNLLIGIFFSFICISNGRIKSSVLYYILGNILLMSTLWSRNMPQVKVQLGMEKKAINWSKNTFFSGLAIYFLHLIPSLALSGLIVMVAPLTNLQNRLRFLFGTSILGPAYFTSFYEVFEENNQNGWRWNKAINEGSVQKQLEKKLSERANENAKKKRDLYAFEYNPDVDDFPPKPKYLDEVVRPGEKPRDKYEAGGAFDPSELVASDEFESYKQERKDARLAPIEVATPSWMGSKPGLMKGKVPSWIKDAYNKYVLSVTKWKMIKPKYHKTFEDVKPIYGPMGFRDKQPDWLREIFGDDIWEERATISRRAARAFGAYRKTMWKKDTEVVLLPCDGADKEKKKPEITKKPDNAKP